MNTQNKIGNIDRSQTVTVRDLCEALANQELSATVEDGDYVVFQGDLKRFLQPTNTVSSVSTMLAMFIHNPIQMAG